MSLFDVNNFKELIKLIPSIQEAVTIGMERDSKAHMHDMKRMRVERSFLKETITLLQGKWMVDILYTLLFLEEPYFNEIKRILPEINSVTLTDRLRFLETKRIITRNVHTDQPIRVVYKMTEFGEGLIKLLLPFFFYYILPKRRFKKLVEKD